MCGQCATPQRIRSLRAAAGQDSFKSAVEDAGEQSHSGGKAGSASARASRAAGKTGDGSGGTDGGGTSGGGTSGGGGMDDEETLRRIIDAGASMEVRQPAAAAERAQRERERTSTRKGYQTREKRKEKEEKRFGSGGLPGLAR